MKAIALLAAALTLTGCAMDPMQQQQFSENFTRGLGATYRQPVYQNPGYSMPIQHPRTTTCRMVGQQMMCDTW